MLLAAWCWAAAVAVAAPVATLTAEQIVEKNVAARGGLEAWRNIRTMVWLGHVETASAPDGKLPFTLQFERPNKTRFAIDPQGQASVRIFNGAEGWKQRRVAGGPPETQPYTEEEVKFARDGQGIDGLLIDHEAKGIRVNLDGIDEVDGKPAYRLVVTLPSGTNQHVWVDANTFLEVKSDREFHGSKGQVGRVSMYYRDYHEVEGLQLPLIIESAGAAAKMSDKMVIDKVTLNRELDPRTFESPDQPLRRKKVLIDTRVPPPSGGSYGSAPAARPHPAPAAPSPVINNSGEGR